jgi:hypothetical protein
VKRLFSCSGGQAVPQPPGPAGRVHLLPARQHTTCSGAVCASLADLWGKSMPVVCASQFIAPFTALPTTPPAAPSSLILHQALCHPHCAHPAPFTAPPLLRHPPSHSLTLPNVPFTALVHCATRTPPCHTLLRQSHFLLTAPYDAPSSLCHVALGCATQLPAPRHTTHHPMHHPLPTTPPTSYHTTHFLPHHPLPTAPPTAHRTPHRTPHRNPNAPPTMHTG